MLPVMVPIVQEKVLGTSAVRVMFGPVPLQVEAVGGFVTVGVVEAVTVTGWLIGVQSVLSLTVTV
jgi:hypothetical protein